MCVCKAKGVLGYVCVWMMWVIEDVCARGRMHVSKVEVEWEQHNLKFHSIKLHRLKTWLFALPNPLSCSVMNKICLNQLHNINHLCSA